MIFSKLTCFGKTGLLASCVALSACETMAAASQSPAPARAVAVVDETTGEGVYYPVVSSVEIPDLQFGEMDGVGPQQRQFFVDQVNLAASTPGQTTPIIVQAVGENRQTLVFMYLGAEGPMTPYLARGVLARLTSITRNAPAIAELGEVSNEFDIYNTASVLGFRRIVVTDGRDFAHEAALGAP